MKPKGKPKIYKQMYTKSQTTPSPSINLQLKPLLYVPKIFSSLKGMCFFQNKPPLFCI